MPDMPDISENQGEYAIETRGLTRRFGSIFAVDDLNLSVATGSIFAFLGRNGAGKSSTIRMITGLLSITEGEALVAGRPVALHGIDVRRTIGYLPDHPCTYDWMTGNEWAATVVRDDPADPVWVALGISPAIAVIAPYAGARILASREL